MLQEDIDLLAVSGRILIFREQRNSVAAAAIFHSMRAILSLGLFDGCEKAPSSDAVPEMCLRDKLQGVLHVMQATHMPGAQVPKDNRLNRAAFLLSDTRPDLKIS